MPHGRRLVRALGGALLVLAGGLVARQAKARAYALPAFRLGPASLRFVDLPPDLDPQVMKGLYHEPWLRFSASLYQPDAEDRIRAVVVRHPLVAEVRSVRVRFPDRADVRVRVRRPAAWFEVPAPGGGRGYVLLSHDARRLPPEPYATYLQRRRVPLPVVRGVGAPPPGRWGQAWETRDDRVAEALAAVRVALDLHRATRGRILVRSIDVSAFPAPPERRCEGEVRLLLDDGTLVEWGRTERARDAVAGEDPYEVKRWRLEKEWARRGRRSGGRIDVRFRLPGEERGPSGAP